MLCVCTPNNSNSILEIILYTSNHVVSNFTSLVSLPCDFVFVISEGYQRQIISSLPNKTKALQYNIYITTFLLFYVRTFSRSHCLLSVGFLLADFRQGYKYPLMLLLVVLLTLFLFLPYVHIPLLFYDVGQHLKKQNLIFVQYISSHYQCF